MIRNVYNALALGVAKAPVLAEGIALATFFTATSAASGNPVQAIAAATLGVVSAGLAYRNGR